jgi:ABC-type dipeptide/oligopeptide/nickel transport system ATPase subunit
MSINEYKIINGNKNLIICFGGMALQFGGILPFEFLNYLSSIYTNSCDLFFFIDRHQCSYHKGIKDITYNIDETIVYINNIIKNGNYEKVIFMGISAGGYGAILFGSMCNNVNHVISFIPQEPLLFHRTIRENIKYGKLDSSDEEMFEAAKKAHIHDVITAMPDGYESLCGEKGGKLSGGQRQRIIIARAILKNAPILILDEATSSLDSLTERLIQDSLEFLMQAIGDLLQPV